jgi:hypothetical protein
MANGFGVNDAGLPILAIRIIPLIRGRLDGFLGDLREQPGPDGAGRDARASNRWTTWSVPLLSTRTEHPALAAAQV